MSTKLKQVLSVLIPALVLIGFMWAAFQFSPQEIIDTLGSRNVYLALFIVGLFSTISTFTSAPFYAALAVAIVGGLDPITVALVVAPAVAIGDIIFYVLVSKASHALAHKYERLERIQSWLRQRSLPTIQVIIWAFFGFVPFSTDIFLSLISLTGAKPRDILMYILLGNFTFFFLLGYLVEQGSPWIEKLIG